MLIKPSAFLTIISIINVFGQPILPSISYISQKQIKDIGSSASLECSVNDAEEHIIVWSKIRQNSDNLLIISIGNLLTIKDSRVSLHYDASTSKHTLQITDIQNKDAGTYQCSIILSVVNNITAEVNLIVRSPPTILDNSTHSLTATEGNSVQMECYAAGYPTPKIMWRRMNNAILPTGVTIYRGNILKIASVRKEDRGTYYCVADNGAIKSDRRTINLKVEFSPDTTAPRPSVGQALQYDVDLKCHIEAYPSPDIIWFKGETQLTMNQQYRISNVATADEFIDTILRVTIIEKSQYGKYYCRATNKLGMAEDIVNLYETLDPTSSPACGVSNTVPGVQ